MSARTTEEPRNIETKSVCAAPTQRCREAPPLTSTGPYLWFTALRKTWPIHFITFYSVSMAGNMSRMANRRFWSRSGCSRVYDEVLGERFQLQGGQQSNMFHHARASPAQLNVHQVWEETSVVCCRPKTLFLTQFFNRSWSRLLRPQTEGFTVQFDLYKTALGWIITKKKKIKMIQQNTLKVRTF